MKNIEIQGAFGYGNEYSIEHIQDESGSQYTRYRGITSERRAPTAITQSERSLSAQIESIEKSQKNDFRYPITNEKKTYIRKWTQFGEPILLTYETAVNELALFGYPRERIKEVFEETFFFQVILRDPEPTYPDYDNSLEYDTITYCIEQN